MAKKKGFMTPERKKKLRTLLRKKAAEESMGNQLKSLKKTHPVLSANLLKLKNCPTRSIAIRKSKISLIPQDPIFFK